MKSVLVCDDDVSILELTQIVLEERGYQVAVAKHSRDIAPALQQQRPDLILLDLWFPEVGGVEVTRHLKAQADTKHIPIVIVSANKDAPKIARQIGADGVLCKPFDLNDLEKVADQFTTLQAEQ